MGWKHPFKSYAEMYDFVSGGRSPHLSGRKYTSAFRLFLRDDHIEINCHSLKLAKLHPDDTLEFVATTRQVWAAGNSLAMNMIKLLPVDFQNFDTGRYKVVHESAWTKLPSYGGYTTAEYDARYKAYLAMRKEAQEYFQGLILNLKTGEIINPKDMTPKVNEDRRKQWLAGLKSFRLRLRAMARVGALDAYRNDEPRYHTYFSDDDLKELTEAIMSGEVSVETARLLTHCTSRWTVQKYSSYGEAVVAVFENTVKSNSRKLRLNAGVITIKD
jgi:hypothetical protein